MLWTTTGHRTADNGYRVGVSGVAAAVGHIAELPDGVSRSVYVVLVVAHPHLTLYHDPAFLTLVDHGFVAGALAGWDHHPHGEVLHPRNAAPTATTILGRCDNPFG